jgi:hypothetical protein
VADFAMANSVPKVVEAAGARRIWTCDMGAFVNTAIFQRWPMRCRGPSTRAQGTAAAAWSSSSEREAKSARSNTVANIKDSLAKIMNLDGALGSCVVDSNSGMMLGSDGGAGPINLEVAAAGNTEVVRAKRKTMKALNLKDTIEDILITLHGQYHLIRPLVSNDALFIYLVLDKTRGNLAMARHQLAAIEKDMVL